ncbi:MAG TPA: helix-turn-helix domain-containing protein [Solirubrobacteraceae bacterium]
MFAANNFHLEEHEGAPAPPPAELRAALTPGIPAIVEEAIAEIRRQGAGSGFSRSALERNLRLGLTDAVDRWFEPSRTAPADLHFALGRAQARAGRSLDELMGFYRLAAQTMWRRVAELGSDQGARPEDLYRLAETGFGCVDEISTQAAAGFSEEHSHRSGASHSRRSEFVRLLLRDPQPPVDVLEAAARTASVSLAPRVAMFVGPGEMYEAFARTARDQTVLGPREGEFVGALFDPDGPGRRERLRAAAEHASTRLALGPSVPLSGARESLGRAQALLALVLAGLIGSSALASVEEHRLELLLAADPGLAGELAERRLAPLQDLAGATTRANLTETLRAWLRAPGQRKTIAHELGVHPQTVRYRMTRLRELFGDALDDPDGRFELDLALRLQPFAELADPEGVSPIPSGR